MPSKKILVVDDERSVTDVLQFILSDLGHKVKSANNVGEATALLDGSPVDLVFTDLRLPDGSGFDLLTHIKRDTPDTQVILMTAHGSVDNASVTIIEFTDYLCPSCAQQHPVLERIVSEFGNRVRLVVRDFPLSQHADALKAAEAAEAAREQGKYWEYTALLFRNQSALEVSKLKQYATELGLDRARFDAALDSSKFAEKVERDVTDGQRLGVDGTPTFYVNGKRVSDRSYEGLKATIEAALKATDEKNKSKGCSIGDPPPAKSP